ncbi:unnamed protein product [Rotaria socialis]
MPALAMFQEDHKKTSSWGYYEKGSYQKGIRNLMRDENMAEAVYREMIDISKINATGKNYQHHVSSFIDMLASTHVEKAPFNSARTQTLITPNEASALKKRLKLT